MIDGKFLHPYWSQDLLIKDLGSNEIILASTDSDGDRLEDFGYWGSGLALSPDGSNVLFTSGGENGVAQLYLKNLSNNDLTLISQAPNGEEGNNYSASEMQTSLVMVDLLHIKLGHRIC